MKILMGEEMGLSGLKKSYSKKQKEFRLPTFDEMNLDFHIEKLVDMETDCLLREIRKFMGEKISNYLRFSEMILQPSSAPIFIFSVIKNLDVYERSKLAEAYKILARFEVEIIELDLVSSEEKEAEFIARAYFIWQDIKSDLLLVIGAVKSKWDSQIEAKNKNYFG